MFASDSEPDFAENSEHPPAPRRGRPRLTRAGASLNWRPEADVDPVLSAAIDAARLGRYLTFPELRAALDLGPSAYAQHNRFIRKLSPRALKGRLLFDPRQIRDALGGYQGELKFHSMKRVCQMLDASLPTLEKLIADGELEAIRVGSLRRIPEDSIRKLVRPWAGALKFVKLSKVARILRVSDHTARLMINSGKIPRIKIGAALRTPVECL